MGRPTETAFKCARCGSKAAVADLANPTATCSDCGDALHSCVNCAHFDTSAHNECRLEDATRIAAKSRVNECGLFKPKTTQEFAADASSPDDARAAFDALFKL